MATKKAHDESPESAAAIPQSGLRVKAVLRRFGPHLHAPSTLPPPPFESEVEVPGLEWWLGAHMALASELLCLEQACDAAPEARLTHAEALRGLSALCGSVRDGLYELYCDAAHPRTADFAGLLPALEPVVRESYAWCVSVLELLALIVSQLRSEADLDWSEAKASHRDVAAKVPRTVDGVREVLSSSSVDFTSPVEPLRNLPVNLEHLASATAELEDALAKRFAP